MLTDDVSGYHDARLRSHDHAGRQVFPVSLLREFCFADGLTALSSSALQVVYQLVAGIGYGGLFQPPLIGVQAAMPLRDMATSTSALIMLRQLGSTVGLSVGQAIWSSVRLTFCWSRSSCFIYIAL